MAYANAGSLVLGRARIALLCLVLFGSMTVPLHAQQWPTGEPVVGNVLLQQTSSEIFLDASQFSKTNKINTPLCSINLPPISTDMCGQIQAAICAAPPTIGTVTVISGVTIDARAFVPDTAHGVTTIPCGSNPFANPADQTAATLTSTPVTLLLPPQTIDTSATWFLPKYAKVIGQNQTVTTIHWTGASPGMGNCTADGIHHCIPVICMGPVSNAGGLYCDTPNLFTNTPRTQVSGLRIDCDAASANTFGLVDITAQEQSWFQNGGAENCAGAGVYIGPTGTDPNRGINLVQNSGPFTNLEINYGSNSTTNTLGMYVQGGPSITVGVGGHITFNQILHWSGMQRPYTALSVNGFQVSVADIHCEKYLTDCVLLGSVADTLGVSVHNVTTACDMGVGVANILHISPAKHTTGVASAVGTIGGTCSPNFSTAILDEQSGFNTGTSQQAMSAYWIGQAGDSNNFYAQGQTGVALLNVAGSLNLGGNFTVNFVGASINGSTGILGAFKAPHALTTQNITCQAALLGCTTSPVFTFYDCGTSATCGSPTTIGSCTPAMVNTIVTATPSTSTVNTGDFVVGKITSATCSNPVNAGATLAY